MQTWDAQHYLKYGTERTRPSIDLAAAIQIESPHRVVDLGCGPGNSTQVLRSRWPSAEAIGVDQSAEMIDAARESFPNQQWVQADANTWSPTEPVDVLFSNAALQWLGDHETLMPRLFSFVAAGGAFAFQIPSSTFATVRTLIHELADDPLWCDRMVGPKSALTMESPSFYYDALSSHASRMDLWETEYLHLMENTSGIVDWIASTGLRPFLNVLQEEERDQFLTRLRQRVAQAYQVQCDGKVLFPFRRTFVIAYS